MRLVPYDVFDADLGERHSNGRPSSVRLSGVLCEPYTGELCKSGYQLGSGNCRRTDGRMVAVPREECLAQTRMIELPF
jgi:hypothetical protein